MAWWYEVRGWDESLLVFGGSYTSRAEALHAAEIAKRRLRWYTANRQILAIIKTGTSERC